MAHVLLRFIWHNEWMNVCVCFLFSLWEYIKVRLVDFRFSIATRWFRQSKIIHFNAVIWNHFFEISFFVKMNLLKVFVLLLMQMLTITSRRMKTFSKFCKENSCKKCSEWFLSGKDVNHSKRHKEVHKPKNGENGCFTLFSSQNQCFRPIWSSLY